LQHVVGQCPLKAYKKDGLLTEYPLEGHRPINAAILFYNAAMPFNASIHN